MVTVIHVVVLVFIIAAGLVKAKPSNLAPFAPFGARGVFSGAAYVYFTYTGFDAVATSAEEVASLSCGHSSDLPRRASRACASHVSHMKMID